MEFGSGAGPFWQPSAISWSQPNIWGLQGACTHKQESGGTRVGHPYGSS